MKKYTTNKLPSKTVEHAKPKDKVYRLRDGGGLYCEVLTTGTKVWRYNYRIHNKQKTFTIGEYPDIGVSEARKRRDKAKAQIQQGVDPSLKKQLDKQALQENTFEAIAEKWLTEKKDGWSKSTYDRVTRYLNKDVYPVLGKREISKIEVPEIIAIVKNVESRGAIDAAKRVKGFIQQVFDYAVVNCKAPYNIAKSINIQLILPKRTKQHFAAITDPILLGELLRAIEHYNGGIQAKMALKISPYVMLRPTELRGAEWSEIDLEKATWTIPAKRRKLATHLKRSNRKEDAHIVPLASQVVALFEELHQYTGNSNLVFPSPTGSGKPISDNTVRTALRRLDFGGDIITPHGFRATASTLLHQQGYRTEVIEAQLAHKDTNEIRAAYNHADYLDERRVMLQEYADLLDTFRQGATVIPIHTKRAS